MKSRLFQFGKCLIEDLFLGDGKVFKPELHLKAAIDWLKQAHDATSDNGVSYGYSLIGAWRPSYIETSGYIATTFFNLHKTTGELTYYDRAVRICHWLRTVQNKNGSFSNPKYDPQSGIVFDTGQDLFGLVRAFRETNENVFLESARRAGNWLVQTADSHGRWTSNTYLGIPHVYNTRVAWALLQLFKIESDQQLEKVARANLDWAISQENNGWFKQCAFKANTPPFTHTIAYAIRGLFESGMLLNESAYLETAQRAATAAITHLRHDGFIPGQIDSDGRAINGYCCLTGNCQLAIIWYKLFLHTQDEAFLNAANSALHYVMTCQDIKTKKFSVRGAIKGSQPIIGKYSPMTYPNWATKFFIDAMLLHSKCNQ